MKKITFLFSILNLFLLFGCNVEIVNIDDTILGDDSDYSVTEDIITNNNQSSTNNETCITTNLIAGQNHIAGTVTVENDGENLIITYTTNGDWTIDATHLSIGGCDDGSIPTTGSGNPKVGKFE